MSTECLGSRREREKTHTGTYTQGMFRRLQFAQVDLPSHLIFRPKLGRLGQYHQTGTISLRTRQTPAKLAGHWRPPRGDLLRILWDGVLLLLLLLRRLVVVHLRRE